MAGLVGAVGAPDAVALVHRGAAPLLRRPWQHSTVRASAEGSVAIGFAGERGGVTADPVTGVIAAIDGELFDANGARTGSAAAEALLTRFLEHGADFEPPEGSFAAAFWDPRRSQLALVTDRLGRRPLYVSRNGNTFLFAGEIKALIAAGLTAEVDLEGWASMLAYEHFLEERTALVGVRPLRAATTLTVDGAGREHERSRWRYRLEPTPASVEELVEEFDGLLRQAVAKRVDGATALALSGGLDSRCLAAVLWSERPETMTASYGMPESDDFILARRVAARAALRHRALPFAPGYIADGIADTVWLSEGHIRSFHVHHLALRPLRAQDGARTLLIGYAGDHLIRTVGGPARTGGTAALPDNFHRYRSACVSDELLDELLTPALADIMRGKARAAMTRRLAEEEGEPVERVRQLLWDNQRRKIWPGAELFADELAPRDPYDDYELVEFGRRLPEEIRVTGSLQRAYLRRFPALAAEATTKEGFAPALSDSRASMAAMGIRARRGVRSRVERRRVSSRWVNRNGFSDYAVDLRNGSGSVLDILLEPRTLERGQLREHGVRRLIDELRAGRARNTRALGVLLTFELFQRQFLDGDGFQATTGGSPEHDHLLQEART